MLAYRTCRPKPAPKTPFVIDLQYPELTVKVLRQIDRTIRDIHGCPVEDSQIAANLADQIESQLGRHRKPDST